MSDFRPCVACQAPVPLDVESCIACGTAQTLATATAVAADAAHARQRELWSSAVLVVGIVAFVLGGGFGVWMRNVSAPAPAAMTMGDAALELSVDEVNDVFLQLTNKAFAERQAPMNLTGWSSGPEGSVIFEMQPPTPDTPAVLWQALQPADREAIMAYVAASYTKALLAAGRPLDFTRDGHPVVILRYRGMSAPVAARLRDGSIRLLPTPFDIGSGVRRP